MEVSNYCMLLQNVWNILLMSLTRGSSYLYCHAELPDRTGAGTDFQQVLSISWRGWPFGHNRHGPKRGDCAPFRSGAGSPSNTMARAEAYLRTKWHLNPCSRFATTDMGGKLGTVPLWVGELGPRLTQCGQGLPPCQVSSWIHPTIWPQYTNVTDRQDNGAIAYGEPFYEQLPKIHSSVNLWGKILKKNRQMTPGSIRRCCLSALFSLAETHCTRVTD